MSRVYAFFLSLTSVSCVAAIVVLTTSASTDNDPKFVTMKCRDDQRFELAIEPTKLQGTIGHLRFQDELNRTRTVGIDRRDSQITLDWGGNRPHTFLGRSVPVSISFFRPATLYRRAELVFSTGDACFGAG